MKTFSIYEAKARFSEIVRIVREQRETITISYHGVPVAEIRPLEPAKVPIEQNLQRLEAAGALKRANGPRVALGQVVNRRGALRRFLAERD